MGAGGAVVVLPLPASLFFRESDGEQVGMTSPVDWAVVLGWVVGGPNGLPPQPEVITFLFFFFLLFFL